MQRNVQADLLAWKQSKQRKPLIIKGARQVGKTWLLKDFGAQHYTNVAYVLLQEIAPGIKSEYAQFFETTNDPKRIVEQLSLALSIRIEPESTLLIFDEIQDCPAAIGSLKRFCEETPEYHVVCAGSLLGVALAHTEGAFPVGKVTFLDLSPFSFDEFLRALGKDNLAEYCSSIDALQPIPDLFTNQLTEMLQRYFTISGMPEAINTWVQTEDIAEVDKVLSDLLGSYERDFAKHGGAKQYAKISRVWHSLPAQLARENKKFLYGSAKSGARAREYEDAITWLSNAGLVRRVNRINAPAIPLSSAEENNAFKLYSLDAGLLRKQANVNVSGFFQKDEMYAQFKGAFAENYALQTLADTQLLEPRYWSCDHPRHEIDFIIQLGDRVIPIEVKSGGNVKSASMRYYANTFPETTLLRIRLSLQNLTLDGNVLNIPLYLAPRTVDFAHMALEQLT